MQEENKKSGPWRCLGRLLGGFVPLYGGYTLYKSLREKGASRLYSATWALGGELSRDGIVALFLFANADQQVYANEYLNAINSFVAFDGFFTPITLGTAALASHSELEETIDSMGDKHDGH